MTTLHPVPADDLYRLAGLRMNDGPAYASDGMISILDKTPDLSFHEIRSAGRPVGMFKLDPRYHERHDFAGADDIGLRGVLIDRDQQRKGFGVTAMRALPAYVRGLYPRALAILLTVNIDNRPARRTYLRAGFADTGALYLGGSLGPQHIMRLTLDRI